MSKPLIFSRIFVLWFGLAASLLSAASEELAQNDGLAQRGLKLETSIPEQSVSMADSVQIISAHFRRPIPGSNVAAAYIQIKNSASQAVTLLGYHSTLAAKIELHESSMQDGMMRMRKIEQRTIAAGSTLAMQSGGYHLMLFELAPALQKANAMRITLEFTDQTSREVELTVQALN